MVACTQGVALDAERNRYLIYLGKTFSFLRIFRIYLHLCLVLVAAHRPMSIDTCLQLICWNGSFTLPWPNISMKREREPNWRYSTRDKERTVI